MNNHEKVSDTKEAANSLSQRKMAIIDLWREKVRDALPAAQKHDRGALDDQLPEFLEALAKAIRLDQLVTEAYDVLNLSKSHAQQRLELGNYTINQVLLEYHFLRQAIIKIINGTAKNREKINNFIDVAIAEAADEFHKRAIAKETEAVHARDQFFSVASHELNTPLASLKLGLQVLLRNLKAGKVTDLEKALSSSFKQIDRLTDLVGELLDVSKIQTRQLKLNLEEIDLSDFLKEVVQYVSEESKAANCEVKILIHDHIVIRADRSRLEQVMVNLLTNAIKYAPGNPIHIEVAKRENLAEVSVQDFGIGIDKTQQDAIFNKFERATGFKKIGGLGLGLFIVRQIVNLHGGTVWVESEPGKGAKFIFTLPLNMN